MNGDHACRRDYLQADFLRGRVPFKRLGADSGATLTSFQTPLATLHKFQGWADKFLTTPPDGIRDLYGSVGYTFTKVGPFDSIGATVVYHDFDSDRLVRDYGHEWDAQIVAKFRKKFTFILKYADYHAETFATDTKKFWASIEYAY